MTNTKILIAEDDASIANLYKTYLETHNFVTERAENGVETLQKIESFQPTILLLDIMMPEKSGLEVLKELHDTQHPVKTIIFSAISNENEKKQAFEYGATAYFVKSQTLMSDILDKINDLSPSQ
jgi:DNA-binding response OmpR family regulator